MTDGLRMTESKSVALPSSRRAGPGLNEPLADVLPILPSAAAKIADMTADIPAITNSKLMSLRKCVRRFRGGDVYLLRVTQPQRPTNILVGRPKTVGLSWNNRSNGM